jgi:drug/metabolite transporter (DMT)-like permease
MSAARRGWLVAIPLGIVVAAAAFLVLRDAGSNNSIGPVDVLGIAAIFAATVYVVLPRPVLRYRRPTRALLAWSAILFFFMLAAAAHQCTSNQPDCKGGGKPLLVFAVWVAGFVVLGIVWMRTDPRRKRRRRRPRKARRAGRA